MPLGRWWLYLVFIPFCSVLASSSQCIDLDESNFVDLRDYALFAAAYGGAGAEGDFNCDSRVDTYDLGTLTGEWLANIECPKYFASPLPWQFAGACLQWNRYSDRFEV